MPSQWPDTWTDDRLRGFIAQQIVKPSCLTGWAKVAEIGQQAQQSNLTTEHTTESGGTADGQQTGHAHGHSHPGPMLAGSGL